jgi:hypothetical protein
LIVVDFTSNNFGGMDFRSNPHYQNTTLEYILVKMPTKKLTDVLFLVSFDQVNKQG